MGENSEKRGGKEANVAIGESEKHAQVREEPGQLRVLKDILKSFVFVFILRTIRISYMFYLERRMGWFNLCFGKITEGSHLENRWI